MRISNAILKSAIIVVLCIATAACALSSGDSNRPRPDAAHLPDAGDAGGGGACEINSDCVVVPETCCGSCGAAVRGDAVAIAVSEVNAQRQRACIGSQGCDACVSDNHPELLATCNAGECQLVDVRERSELTACENPEQCQMRFAGCCQCPSSDDTPILSIHNDAVAAYEALVCDPGQGCPECEPTFPSTLSQGCDGTNHCRIFPIGD